MSADEPKVPTLPSVLMLLASLVFKHEAVPLEYASGVDCVPVTCTVSAGDVLSEWL